MAGIDAQALQSRLVINAQLLGQGSVYALMRPGVSALVVDAKRYFEDRGSTEWLRNEVQRRLGLDITDQAARCLANRHLRPVWTRRGCPNSASLSLEAASALF